MPSLSKNNSTVTDISVTPPVTSNNTDVTLKEICRDIGPCTPCSSEEKVTFSLTLQKHKPCNVSDYRQEHECIIVPLSSFNSSLELEDLFNLHNRTVSFKICTKDDVKAPSQSSGLFGFLFLNSFILVVSIWIIRARKKRLLDQTYLSVDNN